MNTTQAANRPESEKLPWQKVVAKYQSPDLRRSLWQVANTVIPYFILWYLMIRSLEISFWLTLALAIPTGGFLIRTFIIFHDCCHGSFFKSRNGNHTVGFITGILTLTPYFQWRYSHSVHHATAGDLDRRGVGDVWTLTVKEYLELPPLKRLGYRLFRNPLVMFGLGPVFVFMISQRFTYGATGKRERNSVYWTDLALLGIVVLMSVIVGLKTYLVIQLLIMIVGGAIGVWLFYVQHQFEEVYWARHEDWDYETAAMKGCSYYKLPKVLQWFTGNIGYHHIHHLSPRTPNYYLEKCYNENSMFQAIKPLTLLSGLKSLSLRLWDEEQQKLVGFGHLKAA